MPVINKVTVKTIHQMESNFYNLMSCFILGLLWMQERVGLTEVIERWATQDPTSRPLFLTVALTERLWLVKSEFQWVWLKSQKPSVPYALCLVCILAGGLSVVLVIGGLDRRCKLWGVTHLNLALWVRVKVAPLMARLHVCSKLKWSSLIIWELIMHLYGPLSVSASQ